MRRLPFLLALAIPLCLLGCQTSCGKREAPLLWADGVVSSDGHVYETTPMNGTWLHFPSYRQFELPHGLGTKSPTIDAYVSLGVAQPAASEVAPQKVTLGGAGEVYMTIADENTVIVENGTCENEYFLYVKITDTETDTNSE